MLRFEEVAGSVLSKYAPGIYDFLVFALCIQETEVTASTVRRCRHTLIRLHSTPVNLAGQQSDMPVCLTT